MSGREGTIQLGGQGPESRYPFDRTVGVVAVSAESVHAAAETDDASRAYQEAQQRVRHPSALIVACGSEKYAEPVRRMPSPSTTGTAAKNGLPE